MLWSTKSVTAQNLESMQISTHPKLTERELCIVYEYCDMIEPGNGRTSEMPHLSISPRPGLKQDIRGRHAMKIFHRMNIK